LITTSTFDYTNHPTAPPQGGTGPVGDMDVAVAIDFASNTLGKDPLLGEKFGAYVKAALTHQKEWYFKSKHTTGQKVLCMWDFRTDNMVWRKTPAGPAEYVAMPTHVNLMPWIRGLRLMTNVFDWAPLLLLIFACGPKSVRWTFTSDF
jgi:hypothetical protein